MHSPHSYSIQHRIPSQSNEKEIKTVQTRKEKVKLFLFVDDIILHLKDSKNSTKNS
jgi:hypothetical protein